jgi:hypothetical protein
MLHVEGPIGSTHRSPAPGVSIVVGLLLVLYGLGAAPWVSSSDSTTRFVDLTYGDPPYGFAETVGAEVVARPYFNGGAWILLLGVTALCVISIRRPSARIRTAALVASVVAAGWSFAAVLALTLIDLHLGAHLPLIGFLVVAATLLGPVVTRRHAWVLLTSASMAGVVAVIVWFLPVAAFDSSCSLATRSRYANRSACADTIATLTNWFVAATATAIVFPVTAVAVTIRSRRSQFVTQEIT